MIPNPTPSFQSILLEWLNPEKTIIRMTVNQIESTAVIGEVNHQLHLQINEVAHPVDVIYVLKTKQVPEGFLQTMIRIERSLPDNLNRTVIVGGNLTFNQMTREFLMRFGLRKRFEKFYLCATEAEALSILQLPTPQISE